MAIKANQRPYFNHRHELSVEDNCLLWGTCVVIPPQACNQLLEELHIGHPDIERMRHLARSYQWCPRLAIHIDVRKL